MELARGSGYSASHPIHQNSGPIAVWLIVCCILVFLMVIVGGVTRLTQSGLSMVEWAPIMGVVPPVSEAAWLEVFAKYRATPEYQMINPGMSLDEFKDIFYMEYGHRMLGRLIGIAFLLPFLWFLFARLLQPVLTGKLLAVFLLGAAQGLLGWYMVKSGLVHEPHVSPYRLSAHLGLAVIIYGLLLWMVLDLTGRSAPADPPQPGWKRALGVGAVVVVGLMIISGGFVAGTKAGFAFNTYPKMYDRWLPEGMWVLQPVWRNLFENVATVQFIHRCMALVVVVMVTGLWAALIGGVRAGVQRWIGHALLLSLGVQVTLGILTLLYVVPVPLAAAHQAGAMLLLTLLLMFIHRTGAAWSGVRPPVSADVSRTVSGL